MAREGITRAQVFDAADAISATGNNPTVQTIRAKLGTGSFTTITAMLREWKSQTPDNAAELDVPEEVTAALGRAAELVWKAAQDHFRHELATIQADHTRRTAAADQRADDAEAEIERLEKQAEIDARDIEDRENEAKDYFEKLRASEKQCAKLDAELRAANNQIKEQAELLKRLIPAKNTPKGKTVKTGISEKTASTS